MYQCPTCRWTGERPYHPWADPQHRLHWHLLCCPDCGAEVQPMCDACFYRSAFEEDLPIPWWFHLIFRLKYWLGSRVKPLR